MPIDPVCGMEVDENKTLQESRSEYAGTFLFCCKHCKEEFERRPQQCVSPSAASVKPKCQVLRT